MYPIHIFLYPLPHLKRIRKKKKKKTRNTSQPIGCTPATEEIELLWGQNWEKVREGGQKGEFPEAKNITFLTLKKEYRVQTIP